MLQDLKSTATIDNTFIASVSLQYFGWWFLKGLGAMGVTLAQTPPQRLCLHIGR